MIEPSVWGRVRGLLKRANRLSGVCIYVMDGQAELWHDERNGDKPVVERGSEVTVDVSSLLDGPDPDPARVIVGGRTRFTVPGSYGDREIFGQSEWPTFEEAVHAARETIERFEYPGQTPDHRYSLACVALRTEWRVAPQDGPGLGSDTELLRWRVTRDRVILEPLLGHGLRDDQVAAAEALDNVGKQGWA